MIGVYFVGFFMGFFWGGSLGGLDWDCKGEFRMGVMMKRLTKPSIITYTYTYLYP